jgi:hypothetical protein
MKEIERVSYAGTLVYQLPVNDSMRMSVSHTFDHLPMLATEKPVRSVKCYTKVVVLASV